MYAGIKVTPLGYKQVVFTGTCRYCQTTHRIEASIDGWEDYLAGKLLQDAFPDMSADIRELLISGICGKCFDAMFGEEPSEE